MLQIQPEKDIVVEFIKVRNFFSSRISLFLGGKMRPESRIPLRMVPLKGYWLYNFYDSAKLESKVGFQTHVFN